MTDRATSRDAAASKNSFMGQLFELDGGPHGDGCDMAILRGRRGGGEEVDAI